MGKPTTPTTDAASRTRELFAEPPRYRFRPVPRPRPGWSLHARGWTGDRWRAVYVHVRGWAAELFFEDREVVKLDEREMGDCANAMLAHYERQATMTEANIPPAIEVGHAVKLVGEPDAAYEVVAVSSPTRVMIRQEGLVILVDRTDEGWTYSGTPATPEETATIERLMPSPAPATPDLDSDRAVADGPETD
jgi:hypothetical protein